MKVTAILKGMVDSNGHQPIQIRISHQGKQSFRPTGIKVTPSQFENGRVKKHPKASDYNKIIETKIIQLQAEALTGMEKKNKRINFFDFIEAKRRILTRHDSTGGQYQSQINKLREFQSVIFLHDLNHDFFNRYKAFLKDRGNEGNTIWNAFKFLRNFVKRAYNDSLIDKYPFINYEFPKYKAKGKIYLSDEDILKVEAFARVCPDTLKDAAVWFLIGCNTGLRMADMEAFNKRENIIGGRLIVATKKTGEMVGMPVEGKLKEYFEMVNYKPIPFDRQIFSKLIKVVAKSVGIEKKVHPHLFRHSFAMKLANSGVSQEVAAKLLGHRDMRATQTYYRISNKRIDDEMKKLH
jgi:integrase/recombinase XerD